MTVQTLTLRHAVLDIISNSSNVAVLRLAIQFIDESDFIAAAYVLERPVGLSCVAPL